MSRPQARAHTIQFRVTGELYDAIAAAAKADSRTVSGYVRTAVMTRLTTAPALSTVQTADTVSPEPHRPVDGTDASEARSTPAQ